ncbi:hypothetical protein FVEN_g12840 [Fusarium venenatum]|nr:hypothetical protein FVEN_g12840 [Fusarium venenatum]
MRLNLARALKVPLKNLHIDKKPRLITWDSMQREVVLAAEKGAIPWVVDCAVGVPQLLHKSCPAPAPTRTPSPPS